MPALLSPSYSEECMWQAQVADTLPPTSSGDALPAEVDVVVVGAGICGLGAADTLARRGRSVVVFDRERLGWGASSRNGGMVIPELKMGPAALEAKYGPLGTRMFREVNEAFDHVEGIVAGADGVDPVDCDYDRSGQLYLAHSQRHVDGLAAMADELTAAGEPARYVPRGELRGEVGTDAYCGGVVVERTGGLHPARFHAGLAGRALRGGALVHDLTAVTGVARRRGGFVVRTTRGAVAAGQVIVATNAYADPAVPALQRRVLPVGSYIIATEVLPEDLARSVSPTGRMMFDTRNFLHYWRLTPDRRLAFGGRRSLDPTDVADARDFLYERMLAVHPQLEGIAVEYAWGGNVAVTLDRMPHVGKVDGAWYATGCNGSGVALNTWLGHRLAQMLCGDAPAPSFAELRHRAIPLRSWRNAYLPFVSRWFSWEDGR